MSRNSIGINKMSKVAALLMALTLILTACSTGEQPSMDAGAAAESLAPLLPKTLLTLDDFLYDFDNLIKTMNENYPNFGVVERRFGLDINEHAAKVRTMIENYPESLRDRAYEAGLAFEDMPVLNEHVFWSILYGEFFQPFNRIGRTHVWTFTRYFATSGISGVSSPSVFYSAQKDLFERLAVESPELFRFIFRCDPSEAHIIASEYEVIHPIITTDILEENQIAYMNLRSLMQPGGLGSYTNQALEFYESIQGYAHLIIDIRECGGGQVITWSREIMNPLWPDRASVPKLHLFAFFRGNQSAFWHGEMFFSGLVDDLEWIPASESLLSIEEILESNDMPHFNEDDLLDFGYGFEYIFDLSGSKPEKSSALYEAYYPFKGRIWLLTSSNNWSGSAVFANYAKALGFATLVGDTVEGVQTLGANNVHILERCGITVQWDMDYTTDEHGRAIEEFPTTPHYFNREGMDALETTLSLINEGS